MAREKICSNCNANNNDTAAFCERCGTSLSPDGAIVDGQWQRSGNELVRRVDPEDARKFLGSRTVLVPAGTVGLLVVDGLVEKILPPGEQTSLPLFERVTNFFLSRDRTAFFLVDQRPFSIAFMIQTPANLAGQSMKTQALVTFTLPRGDRTGLANFLANVVGTRAKITASDLYDLLRPEVTSIAQTVIERAAAVGPISYPDAESQIRTLLAGNLAARYGLTVDATLAPIAAGVAVSLLLGDGDAGQLSLFSSDNKQIELDLQLRVSGSDIALIKPDQIGPAIASVMANHLRNQSFDELVGPGGFASCALAIRDGAVHAMIALGLTLSDISVLDARSKSGQWAFAARAQLEQAAQELRIGLERLDQRDQQLDLEALVLTRALREQQQRRDHNFAQDTANLADRERRTSIESQSAELDRAKIARDAATRAAVDEAERVRRQTLVQAELAELKTRRDSSLETVEKTKRLELDLSRMAEQQQLDKLRAMAELDAQLASQTHAHELEKRAALRGLSADAIVAMQAGELARTDSGSAWASAFAQRGGVEAAKQHAEQTRAVYDTAMSAMATVASSRAEAPPVTAAIPLVHVSSQTKSCAGCSETLAINARFCSSCGATV
jgi:hypothetical protein